MTHPRSHGQETPKPAFEPGHGGLHSLVASCWAALAFRGLCRGAQSVPFPMSRTQAEEE